MRRRPAKLTDEQVSMLLSTCAGPWGSASAVSLVREWRGESVGNAVERLYLMATSPARLDGARHDAEWFLRALERAGLA